VDIDAVDGVSGFPAIAPVLKLVMAEAPPPPDEE